MSLALKIKLPARSSNSPAPQAEHFPTSRKRRRTEEQVYVEDDSAMDVNIDIDGSYNNQTSASSRSHSLVRKSSSTASNLPSAPPKKHRKHRNVVYSDDDEDLDMELLATVEARDDADGDFVPASPSHSTKAARKAAKAKTGGETTISLRDQRRFDASATSSTLNSGPSQAAGGIKKSRNTDDMDFEPEPLTVASASTITQDEDKPAALPPKKKFPPIKKKNKTITAATAIPPASADVSAAPSLPAKPPPPAPTVVLPSQPPPPIIARKPAPNPGATDVDLMNADVYASLFSKSANGQTPRAGLGQSREKEMERRKELDRMRDEARVARLAELERTAFDLSFAQDKVAAFEAMLKERNSVALFPHHLASYLKHNTKRL